MCIFPITFTGTGRWFRPATFLMLLVAVLASCGQAPKTDPMQDLSASELLGNPDYPAISYGGYRGVSRSEQPTLAQLKEDMRILHAMGIRFLRTYNVQLPHASNVVKAISELKQTDPDFEMYVMLGAWIDCEGAWTGAPNHAVQDFEANGEEIQRAVALTQQFPDIVKVIAVGNEAMVHWAASYFVAPEVILHWVHHLQGLKAEGALPGDLWITSSDNFASWGGGGPEYHNADLDSLILAVDYVSMHTYPFHDTHYNPTFWKGGELDPTDVNGAMGRAVAYSQNQYASVVDYVRRLDPNKPVHIGETGWASVSDGFYGPEGSRASDEYKQALFYHGMREWTQSSGISCFYFEAFDEPWKSAANPTDSENHFGLFTKDGEAKFAIWPLVEQGVFDGLTRDGHEIRPTYAGQRELLDRHVLNPAP
ncbi:MAG TPA: glycosyl hydrolase family 17 [Flavobacteriales bacterium]|nr:glycosyl hydrolase family 17 [Flavobacteriales bacterium]